MTTIEKLRADRAYVLDAMRSIRSAADAETRSTNPDETARFAEGEAFVVECDRQIEEHNTLLRLSTEPAHVEAGASFDAPNTIVRDSPFTLDGIAFGDTAGVRSQALRAIEADATMEDRHREEAERVVRTMDPAIAARVALTSSPEYGRAFMKAVAGREHLFTDDERLAVQRAVSLGGTAGYAVPAPIDTTIIDTGSHSVNPFRQLATVKKITGTDWTGVSSAGVTASWDGEGVEVSDDAPTLVQPKIPTFKGAAFVPFSLESEDWANLASDVRVMIANAKDDLEGAAFVSGNGSSAPQGVATALDGTASEIAPTTAETFAKADIDKLIGSLQARYRKNAAFVGNVVWYNAIRAFETTINTGALLSRESVQGTIGGPGMLNLAGFPAFESSDMDAVLPNAAATADNFGLIFGDLAAGYYIVDRVGLNIELIPHLFHTDNNRPSGQRGFYAWFRTGAEVVNVNAIKMLSIPTAA